MKIIPATGPEEREACFALRFTVFVGEQGVPAEIELDELDRPGAACSHFLMIEDGRPIGTFRCSYESPDTVHFQRFCILPEMRGREYGRAALDFVREKYAKEGVRRITLNAQCRAVGFYEKCGFTVTSGVFDDAGIPHQAMEAILPEGERDER